MAAPSCRRLTLEELAPMQAAFQPLAAAFAELPFPDSQLLECIKLLRGPAPPASEAAVTAVANVAAVHALPAAPGGLALGVGAHDSRNGQARSIAMVAATCLDGSLVLPGTCIEASIGSQLPEPVPPSVHMIPATCLDDYDDMLMLLPPPPPLESAAAEAEVDPVAVPELAGQPAVAGEDAFDYLLDEPTPPPKKLPKGTRYLKPGQRAGPPRLPQPAPGAAPAPVPAAPQPALQQPLRQPQENVQRSPRAGLPPASPQQPGPAQQARAWPPHSHQHYSHQQQHPYQGLPQPGLHRTASASRLQGPAPTQPFDPSGLATAGPTLQLHAQRRPSTAGATSAQYQPYTGHVATAPPAQPGSAPGSPLRAAGAAVTAAAAAEPGASESEAGCPAQAAAEAVAGDAGDGSGDGAAGSGEGGFSNPNSRAAQIAEQMRQRKLGRFGKPAVQPQPKPLQGPATSVSAAAGNASSSHAGDDSYGGFGSCSSFAAASSGGGGFSFANGKGVQISEAARQRSAKLFANLDPTARGHTVPVSAKALERAAAATAKLDKDGDAAAASVSARVSASAGLAPASASAPTSVLGAAAEFGQDLGGGMAATGFQTAGGRVVAVSAQALKRRAEFMAKLDKDGPLFGPDAAAAAEWDDVAAKRPCPSTVGGSTNSGGGNTGGGGGFSMPRAAPGTGAFKPPSRIGPSLLPQLGPAGGNSGGGAAAMAVPLPTLQFASGKAIVVSEEARRKGPDPGAEAAAPGQSGPDGQPAASGAGAATPGLAGRGRGGAGGASPGGAAAASAACTPIAGLRGPPASVGGLRRPRPSAAGDGSAARPPRPASAPAGAGGPGAGAMPPRPGMARAGSAAKRKFVSPVPAGDGAQAATANKEEGAQLVMAAGGYTVVAPPPAQPEQAQQWGWWGAAEAQAALQALPEAGPGALSKVARPLASEEFPAHCRHKSLTPVELAGGARPVLATILAHDRSATFPMVLTVSALPNQQQQQPKLSDGWYAVPAGLDAALAQLVMAGRIRVGSKLRVCGAELASERPCDPLDGLTSGALLRLHYNGVAPGGGPVSATLLLVASRYGVMHVAGGVHRSPRAQEERVNRALVQRGEAASRASTAAQRAELERCQRAARGAPGPSVFPGYSIRVQRAYANMVVAMLRLWRLGPEQQEGFREGHVLLVSRVQQWVFLADHTSGMCGGAGLGGGEGAGGGGGGTQPWMLAVKLIGSKEAIDFIQDPQNQSGAIYSFKHLQLITRDNANQLWVAAAPDVCSLSRVAPPPPHSAGGGGGGGGQQPGRRSSLGGGMASGPGSGDPVQLELYGRKIDRLRGGGIRRMWVILLEVQMGVEAHEGAALQQPGEATGELTQVARV
eukprot:XP_001693439.1 predicted protein [Chlamydomonas reinhardtii]